MPSFGTLLKNPSFRSLEFQIDDSMALDGLDAVQLPGFRRSHPILCFFYGACHVFVLLYGYFDFLYLLSSISG